MSKTKQISRPDLIRHTYNTLSALSAPGHALVTEDVCPKNENDKAGWVFRQQVAYDLWVAHTMRAQGNKLFENFKEASYKAGMFSMIEGMDIGTSAVAFEGPLVMIVAKKQRPIVKVDALIMCAQLRNAGVSANVISKAFDASRVTQKPAIVIEPVLKP